MKKIYVSVEELLDNGGSLLRGRALFNEQGDRMGEYKGINSEGMHLVGLYSQPCYSHEIYVEIDCQPIYK